MKSLKTSKVVIGITSIYLALPLVLTLIYSLFVEWKGILPSKFTLKYYTGVLTDTTFYVAIGRSLMVCIIAIAITTLIMLLTMYIIIIYFPGLDMYIQAICMIPYSLQGIIIAISILTLYSGSGKLLGNRMIMLVATYCIVILPYIYQGIRNSLVSINARQLINAAQVLGCTRLRAFFMIVVPNITSGITISVLLSIGIIFGDFVVVNIIAGSGFETASIFLFKLKSQSGQSTSAVIILLFMVTLAITTVAFSMKNKQDK